jgi:NAD+ synthase (glutamine-hydrolysing)
MNKVKPIKDLRDTAQISKDAHASNEPIIITKNGHKDLVLMSDENYNNLILKKKEEILPSTNLGYLRVSSATIDIRISDVNHNLEEIKKTVSQLNHIGSSFIVFHELCITGYTCGDLFLNQELLENAKEGLIQLKNFSKNINSIFVVGCPLAIDSNIYNCGVVIFNGKILGIVPKTHIPNYSEFYESRYFLGYTGENTSIFIGGENILFGTKIIFQNKSFAKFKFAVEICEDVWTVIPPSSYHVQNGALVIANLSASPEVIGKYEYRNNLISSTSSREISAYIYSACGKGESTQDLIYSGHNIIAENGHVLSESLPFENKCITSDIDLDLLYNYRQRISTFKSVDQNYDKVYFNLLLEKPKGFLRPINKNPFVPKDRSELEKKATLILQMQAHGLIQRINHINCHKLVIGISGGLDSTLALLVAVTAFKILGYSNKDIYAISIPSFGTTDLTHGNAYELSKVLGCTYLDININDSVSQHFKDIGHDPENQNAAFENSQARERTQVLMDFANDNQAIMVGTGDLSELCLGWTTYAGDHMSMYGVNSGVPKTLVKYLVKSFADDNPSVKKVLYSILDTPISPELIPAKKGKIQQKTEDFVGPYYLTDFFIYYFLRRNYTLEKIFYLANQAYKDDLSPKEIYKWLESFIKRFFAAQFKRSCLPDGVKIGSVAISPRGDWRMPSDASYQMYLTDLEKIKAKL